MDTPTPEAEAVRVLVVTADIPAPTPTDVPPTPDAPPANLNAQYWTMGVIVTTVVALLVEIDVFAFLNRAFATISQVGLHIQVKYFVLVPFLALVCGTGEGHLTLSRVPGTPYNWRAITAYAALYAALTFGGVFLGSTVFAQQPNVD